MIPQVSSLFSHFGSLFKQHGKVLLRSRRVLLNTFEGSLLFSTLIQTRLQTHLKALCYFILFHSRFQSRWFLGGCWQYYSLHQLIGRYLSEVSGKKSIFAHSILFLAKRVNPGASFRNPAHKISQILSLNIHLVLCDTRFWGWVKFGHFPWLSFEHTVNYRQSQECLHSQKHRSRFILLFWETAEASLLSSPSSWQAGNSMMLGRRIPHP